MKWKPHLIIQLLESESIRENDILVYHDSDVSRYPEYFNHAALWRSWFRRTMRNLDVLCFNDNNAGLYSDTKPELLEAFFGDSSDRGYHHIWAGAIGIRKNNEGRKFAKHWDELCTLQNLAPFTAYPERKNFHKHSHEQAVLGCIWHSRHSEIEKVRRRSVYLHKARKIPPPSGWMLMKKRAKRSLRKKIRTLRRKRDPSRTH